MYFYAGKYELSAMYNGSVFEARNDLDMWVNPDHVVRRIVDPKTRERVLVLSNGDQVTYTEEDPF